MTNFASIKNSLIAIAGALTMSLLTVGAAVGPAQAASVSVTNNG